MKYCQSKEYVTENVADGRIDGALPFMTKKKGNFRAVDYREMPEVYKTVETQFKNTGCKTVYSVPCSYGITIW